MLKRLTGIQPTLSREDVQKKYMHYIREKSMYRLKMWVEATGIQPDLPEDFVQKKYCTFVRKGELDDFKGLIELTGIQPSEEVYRLFIDKLSERKSAGKKT